MAKKIGVDLVVNDKGTKKINKFSNNIGGLSKKLLNLKTAFVGVAATAGIGAFVKATLKASDSIAKTADKIGLTTDALQELRYAASRAGVETSTIDMAMQRFIRRFAEAKQGVGELKDVLNKYNITTDDSMEAFNQLANVIATTEDKSERLRIAFKAFDSEGVGLVNMLKLGSAGMDALRKRANELGIVLDNELLRKAEALNDGLTDLKEVISKTLMRAFLELADPLKVIVDNMTAWAKANKELITDKTVSIFEDMVEITKFLSQHINELITAMKFLSTVIAFRVAVAFSNSIAVIAAYGKSMMGITAASQKTVKATKAVGGSLVTVDKRVGSIRRKFLTGRMKTFGIIGVLLGGAYGITRYLTQIEEFGNIFKAVTASLKYDVQVVWLVLQQSFYATIHALKNAWADFTNWIGNNTPDILKERLGITTNIITKPINQAGRDIDERLATLKREYRDYLEQLRKSEMPAPVVKPDVDKVAPPKKVLPPKTEIIPKKLDSDVADLYAWAPAGAPVRKPDPEKTPIGGMDAVLDDLIDKWFRTKTTMTKIAQTVGESLAYNIGGPLMDLIEGTKTLKEAFSDMTRSMGRELIQMGVRLMILRAVKSVFNFGGAAAEGGIFPGGFQPFANGGIVNKPTLGLIGEGHNSEAVIPLKNGNVPVEMRGGSKALINSMTINVTASPGMTDADAKKQGKQIARSFQSEIDRRIMYHKRPGGMLA